MRFWHNRSAHLTTEVEHATRGIHMPRMWLMIINAGYRQRATIKMIEQALKSPHQRARALETASIEEEILNIH